MVVDDNHKRFRKFQNKLKYPGVRIIHAQNEDDFFFYFHNQSNDIPDIIFLDHDLSILDADHNTKRIVLRLIEQKEMFANTQFVVHSLNDFGGAEIYLQLKEAGFNARREKGAYEYVNWNRDGTELTFNRIF
jgi:hypothetical protein